MKLFDYFRSIFADWRLTDRDFLGMSEAAITGERVTADSAMRVASVYACVNILSQALASLPLNIYRRDPQTGKRAEAYDHPLYKVLVKSPNQFQTSFEYIEMLASHLLLRGAHYSRIYTDQGGRVRALMPLHPDLVAVVYDYEKNKLIYSVTQFNGQTETLDADQVLHVRGLHSDILHPISPIGYAKETIGLDQALFKHAAQSFGPNRARPGGVITAEGKITPDTAARILSVFNSRYAGGGNAGKTMLLDRGMQFAPITVSNGDQQFLETRQMSLEDVCRIFNVPPSLIHHNTNSTMRNAEQFVLSFVKFSLRPLITRVVHSLERACLGPTEWNSIDIDFDVADLLRGDNTATANYARTLVQGGIATPNEARDLVGLDRLDQDGADELYIQQNMSPLTAIDEGLDKAAGVTDDQENENGADPATNED